MFMTIVLSILFTFIGLLIWATKKPRRFIYLAIGIVTLSAIWEGWGRQYIANAPQRERAAKTAAYMATVVWEAKSYAPQTTNHESQTVSIRGDRPGSYLSIVCDVASGVLHIQVKPSRFSGSATEPKSELVFTNGENGRTSSVLLLTRQTGFDFLASDNWSSFEPILDERFVEFNVNGESSNRVGTLFAIQGLRESMREHLTACSSPSIAE